MTEIVEIDGRGHSLTIDSGWRDVCDKALKFVAAAGHPVTVEVLAGDSGSEEPAGRGAARCKISRRQLQR